MSNVNDVLKPAVQSKTCLIVDDSRVVRRVARRILEDLNFVVDEACDGQQGLEACLRAMPDAILLDWNMPVMEGIDFLRALRKTEGGNAPAVLFCTTEGDIAHIQAALDAGANEYIIKPFDSEILTGKLAQLGLA